MAEVPRWKVEIMVPVSTVGPPAIGMGWGTKWVEVVPASAYDEKVKQYDDLEKKYNELIFAVSLKFPNESRHGTALHYIQQSEAVSTCLVSNQRNPPLGVAEKTDSEQGGDEK